MKKKKKNDNLRKDNLDCTIDLEVQLKAKKEIIILYKKIKKEINPKSNEL